MDRNFRRFLKATCPVRAVLNLQLQITHNSAATSVVIIKKVLSAYWIGLALSLSAVFRDGNDRHLFPLS